MGVLSGETCLRLLLMIAWFSSLNSIWSLSSRTHKKDGDINFNRNFTGVYFDPSDFKMYNALPQTLDEDALVTFLKVIHTRFDKVLVTLHVPRRRGGDRGNDLLPEVAARHNQFLNGRESTTVSTKLKMDVMCGVDNWDNEGITQPRLNEIKKVVDGANSFYSGTVNSVTLEIADLNDKAIRNFKAFLTEFGTGHKVGIKLNLETCVNVSSSESSISKTFMNDLLTDNYLETVYLEEDFDPTATSMSVSQALNILQSQFSRCKELVHKLNKEVSVALITTWSDTDDKGRAKFSKFVDFWVQVNKWAEESNTSVILRQAFDTPLAKGSLTMKTSGWWRLIPNSSYLRPSQFVFEEKALIIHSNMTTGRSREDQTTWLGQPTEFSRSVIGVHFDLFVLKSGFVQSVSEMETSLLTLIQQISTKFSKILMSTILTEYDLSDRYSNTRRQKQKQLFSVPIVLAKWNKNQSSDTTSPMELMLTFNEYSAQSVSRSAVDANQLFPGTVTQLIYSPISLDEDKFLDGYSAIVKISNRTRSSSFGIKINLEVCNDHLKLQKVMGLLQDYFSDDLKLSVIYFESLATETLKVRSDRLFPVLTVMFENCKKTLDEYLKRSHCNDNVEVAFITGWPITSEETLEDLVQFTTFWEGINDWASKTNTTVMLYSAFDPITSSTPSPGKREAKYGWWSIKHNSLLGEQYSFEDKKIAAYKYASEMLDNDSYTSSQLVTVIVTSVAALIAIVIVALLTVFYLLKRRQSNILTKEEIAQFFTGGDSSAYTGSPENMNGPYQKLHLELPTKSFTINEDSPLGSGAYGKVCVGTVTRDGEVEEEVAVKMTKIPSTGFALRGLLFEIKILSYLGKHPHVVGLVGAYTAELRKSKVYVFLELCGLGSLLSFLRKCRSPTNKDSEAVLEQPNCEEERLELDDVLVSDMVRWSCEIAKGMEFITSKHIVHLDLATRNVLLTSEKQAKITDFGLSRRMYDYQSYIKKHQEPLPWRSMAPESLRRSEFTEKSDVWAFGILLWEIYSLGDEPFPGLSWEVNFPTKLERGLRPGEPTHNRNSMYSIMLRCWTTNPAGRPTFSELVTYLSPALVEAGRSGRSTSNLTPDTPFYENVKIPATSCKIPFTSTSTGNVDEMYDSTFPKSMKKMCPPVLWMWLSLAIILLLIFLFILIWSPWMTGGLASSATSSNAATSVAPPPIRHRILTTNQTSNRNDRIKSRNVSWPHADSGLGRGQCKDTRNITDLGHKLFIAIDGSGNKEEAVSILVQRGADVNVRDELGQTPLIAAANCSNDKSVCLRVAELLIENGANVSAENNEGETFLYNFISELGAITPSQFHQIAVYLISKNMTELLADIVQYKNDSSVNFPLWYLAVWNIEVENRTLSMLSKKIANFRLEMEKAEPQILAVATSARRSPQLLSFLIELGANWRHLNSDNISLLHIAASWCYPDGVAFYLRKGLDANAPVLDGFTPLHLAAGCTTGNVSETIRILIGNGANANAKIEGATPLAVVNERGNFPDKDKVILLLKDAEC